MMCIPPRLKTSRPFTTTLILVFVASIFTKHAYAQGCAAGSAQELGGNWYCSEVKAIKYQNFPGKGFYNRVTDMNSATGQCSTQKYAYSGSLSPLDEELSLHIRGPTRLKNLAVYAASGNPNAYLKRDLRDVLEGNHHQHGRNRHSALHHSVHGRHRQARHEVKKRAVGDMVIATIDGQVVSWKNTYAGPSTAPQTMSGTVTTSSGNQASALATIQSSAQSSSDATSSKVSDKSSGYWDRLAYYDAAGAKSDGLTFLNHFGGAFGIPGTAAGGPAFGASLSYASSDGKSGAATPQMLEDALIDDGVEVVVLSNKVCQGDCGYTRPGGVAYHGFGGSRKIFLLEFSMPVSGQRGFNGDMPGIWLLNAQIPLTSQYGTNSNCSCWTSGCGEFDLFEVLDSGNFRCKSTLHMAPAGGSSDWFRRPTMDTITAAVVFAGPDNGILVKVLDEAQDFGGSIEDEVVQGWLDDACSSFNMQI